jgi:uncharacterized protein (TIGR02611 family)
MTPPDQAAPGERTAFMARLLTARAYVRRLPGGWLLWRVAVTIVGVVVLVAGAIMIPFPGPGWLVVFLGLGILSTEYEWARRLTTAARRLLTRWWRWLGRLPRYLQWLVGALGLAFTAAISIGAWLLL